MSSRRTAAAVVVVAVALVLVAGIVVVVLARSAGEPAAASTTARSATAAPSASSSTRTPSQAQSSSPGVPIGKGDYLDLSGAARFHAASLELWWGWHGRTATGRDYDYSWGWEKHTATVHVRNRGPGRVWCEIRMGGELLAHDEGRRVTSCSADTTVRPMVGPVEHNGSNS